MKGAGYVSCINDGYLSQSKIMKTLDQLPYQSCGAGLSMLQNITVVDLTTSVAGPYATQLLADLGATVIKVEKIAGGDDARAWGPPFLYGESLWFLSVNRNKESLTLDISQPVGQGVLDALLTQADVLVVNLVPHIQEKLGIDYASLSSRHPRLIHASLTGFGLQGSRQNQPCYDLIAEGYSGVMDLTGEADQTPQKVGTPAADLLAGQDAALAILAALLERHRTGRGKQIDISMVQSMTRFMAPRIVPYLGSEELPQRSGGKDSVIAIYQVFETADLPLTLGLGNDAIWARFWEAVGEPAFAKHSLYASNGERRVHRADIAKKIALILVQKSRDFWLSLFEANRIPAGPINRIDQVVNDVELLRKRFFYAADGSTGLIPQVGLGITFDGQSDVHRSSPPRLGEHTEAILRDRLGMSEARITSMKNSGVI